MNAEQPYKTSLFHLSTKVIFSVGAVAGVGNEIKTLRKNMALVVTDQGCVKAGLLEPLLNSLNVAKIQHRIFSGVTADPPIRVVEDGVKAYRDNMCDCLIAIGGGSSIDTAKAIGVMVSNPGVIVDYVGVGKIKVPLPPLLAIPTTCGTGSEVTRSTIITDPSRHLKMVIGSPLVAPMVAIVDPELLSCLPPHLVASTAMDALTHAVEAYTNRNVNPITDSLAIGAIRLIGKNLRTAVAGGNIKSLLDIALASTLAGIAFTHTILAAVHALSHPLGVWAGVPHGLANAILLPHVVRFNCLAVPERSRDIAQALGKEVEGLKLELAAQLAAMAIEELSVEIGIPRSLKELKINEDLIPNMVEDAMGNINATLNPRRMSATDAESLYQSAIIGI